jgi:hypothetical protein
MTEVLTPDRLGKIHGVEIPRRDRHYEQDGIQGGRSD